MRTERPDSPRHLRPLEARGIVHSACPSGPSGAHECSQSSNQSTKERILCICRRSIISKAWMWSRLQWMKQKREEITNLHQLHASLLKKSVANKISRWDRVNSHQVTVF